MRPILSAFPIPNGFDYGSSLNPNLAEFIQSFSLPSKIDSTSIRLDETLSPKLTVFFRAAITPSSTGSRPYFAKSTTAINAQTYTLGANSQLATRWSN